MAKLTGGLRYWTSNGVSCTLERNSPTKSTSGVSVASWATVKTFNAVKWPKKKQNPDSTLDREDWHGEFEFATDTDPEARPGDRLVVDGKYYYIKAVTDFGNDTISFDVPYIISTELRRS